MRALLLLFALFLVFAGCPSNGSGESAPLIVPYFEGEEFSEFTGELERYVSPHPDEYGYTSQHYAVMGLSCPNGISTMRRVVHPRRRVILPKTVWRNFLASKGFSSICANAE